MGELAEFYAIIVHNILISIRSWPFHVSVKLASTSIQDFMLEEGIKTKILSERKHTYQQQ